MGSEKCKNSGNGLSRGKEAIHGPRKPRGALGHLPWGEAERLLWLARANEPRDAGKFEESRKKGAWEVGSAPWNEQTRISAVGSTGRPDRQSGLSGLYRLIGVAFSCGAGCVGFPRD
ncbi:hypothetical protein CRG98_028339 [Punica granatum]|uniref:Uncharacterized protein n=1 Tax=Punica granatum TaxID=22663 RepID=A0A2I0J4X2_PUNGR|nr:hypothetical protein CRG98_028339 [Punica granatum]